MRLGLAVFVASISFAITVPAAVAADKGVRDFSFGTSIGHPPTSPKPESKVWWNDGIWWGCLFNTSLKNYDIYRLDDNKWTNTGTPVDSRVKTSADVLWDQEHEKLYVASHIFAEKGASSSSSSNWARLYRYTYHSATKIYSLDSGFPVEINKGTSETLVLAKDSKGTLWVTYIQGSKVMVNHSNGSDNVWATPYTLPVTSSTASVQSDDETSIISFDENKIGIMWSNQKTARMYFAVHEDGSSPNTWQAVETALGGGVNCSSKCADDHINLKTDTSGRLYAAIKTSQSGTSDPRIRLLVRSTSGSWASYTYSTKKYDHTRPMIILDSQNNRLYMFATAPESSGNIYVKSTPLDKISFKDGLGDLFIDTSKDTKINNATSTKQNLNHQTGLLVLAGDDEKTHYYVHNFVELPEN
jgi:hypothetical protein